MQNDANEFAEAFHQLIMVIAHELGIFKFIRWLAGVLPEDWCSQENASGGTGGKK